MAHAPTVPDEVNIGQIKSEIRQALINNKAFACPIGMRVAWHSAGTFDKNTNTGGSDGATIRFPHERSDPANAGLHIIQDMLLPIAQRHPELSKADLHQLAGCVAVELMGGPEIPFYFGRRDDVDESRAVEHGRLPDASQGAAHLREVFGRMGFNDREIVALSGGHTVGRCHIVRSSFDGKWTHNPLKFDNSYFKHLMDLEWVERRWDGPKQYTDVETGKLMMLPTDMALKTDPVFRTYARLYADDQATFFADFRTAYAKLMALGCPAKCDPFNSAARGEASKQQKMNAEFRELCMHGSLEPVQKLASRGADVHELETSTQRSALHKAAFWGHILVSKFLLGEKRLDPNVQDIDGDTPLHEAARYGHLEVVKILLADSRTRVDVRNKAGETPRETAAEHGYDDAARLIAQRSGRQSRL